MKVNKQLFQINRNFAICFIVAAVTSASTSHLLSDIENYLNTSITVGAGYVSFFGIFSFLFYIDNRKRYKKTESDLVKNEVYKLISSLGIGEIVYIIIRWLTLYYFLEIDVEAFLASLYSSIIAAILNMTVVTMFLRKTKTF